jgi:hypothetical protein
MSEEEGQAPSEAQASPPLDSDAAALAALVAQLEDDGAVEDLDDDAARVAELMAAKKPKLTEEQLRRNAKNRRVSKTSHVLRVAQAREAGPASRLSFTARVERVGVTVL